MKALPKRPECFYCGALFSGNGCGDHFPTPQNAGGTETVPCCVSCHDMKDRFSLYKWPEEWIRKVIADFPNLSRETRLFLARWLRGFAESMDEIKRLRARVSELEGSR